MNKVLFIFCFLTMVGCRTLGNIPSLNLSPYPNYTTPPPSYTHSNLYAGQKSLTPVAVAPPSIDGYDFQDSSVKFMSSYPNRDLIHKNMVDLKIDTDPPENCTNEREYKHYIIQNKNMLQRNRFLKFQTSKHNANYIQMIESKYLNDKYFLNYKLYDCASGPKRTTPAEIREASTSQTEFDLMIGSYIARNGFLKKLGNVGPTVGLNIINYNKNNYSKQFNLDLGWYFHVSLDHFFNTDSSFLKPKFGDEDYTNYMWSFGASFRYSFSDEIKMNYTLGPAINFLEIDTSGSNYQLSDEEATRTTFSIVHQLGLYYYIDNPHKNSLSKNSTALGINLLYYYMPDALGFFARSRSDIDSYNGGSFSLMLSLKSITF